MASLSVVSFTVSLCTSNHLIHFVGLESVGLTIIQDMPPYSLAQLFKRVGFAKTTHYGSDFRVESKEDPNNLAYTSSTLGLHLDLPFYEYNPGVKF